MSCNCIEITRKITTVIEQGPKGDTGPKGDDGPIGPAGSAGSEIGGVNQAVTSGDFVATNTWQTIPGLLINLSDPAIGYMVYFTGSVQLTTALTTFEMRLLMDNTEITDSVREFSGGKPPQAAGLTTTFQLPVFLMGRITDPLGAGDLEVQIRYTSTPGGVTTKDGLLMALETRRA